MKRWFVIRHIRWASHTWRMRRHYQLWSSVGFLPVYLSHDQKYLLEIWKGER